MRPRTLPTALPGPRRAAPEMLRCRWLFLRPLLFFLFAYFMIVVWVFPYGVILNTRVFVVIV